MNISKIEMTADIRSAVGEAGVDSTRGAYALGVFNGTGLIAIDNNCEDDGYCLQRLGDDEFWTNHEIGHIAYMQLGMPLGSYPEAHERGAQCIAELVTMRPPNLVNVKEGYWNCPDDKIAMFRWIMVAQGMMEPNEFIGE